MTRNVLTAHRDVIIPEVVNLILLSLPRLYPLFALLTS
jgi:hypothetical protein